MNVEPPATIMKRIPKVLEHLSIEVVILAPERGMKYLPRGVVYGRLCTTVEVA